MGVVGGDSGAPPTGEEGPVLKLGGVLVVSGCNCPVVARHFV